MDSTETLKSKNRVAWLDAAKLSGIFLVILGHIQIRNYGFFSPGDFIFVFHMPLFFFLSGLTQKNLSFKENLKDGIRKLLVPYVVFYFLTWLYWFPVSCLRHPELYPDVFRDGIVRAFLGIFLSAASYSTKWAVTTNGPIWFLLGLFWCKMIYSLVQTKAENPQKINFIVSVFLLFLGFVLRYFEIPKINVYYVGEYELKEATREIPLALASLTSRYVYFFAGTLMKEKLFTNELCDSSKIKRLFLAVLFLIFTVVVYFFNSRYEMTDIFLSILGAVCGMIFVYELSVLISPLPEFFGFLGRNTITILAFHGITTSFARFALKLLRFPISTTQANSFPAALFLAVISLLLCAIPSFIFEKWFPFVLGRKKREEKSVRA